MGSPFEGKSALRNDGCTCYCSHAHSFTVLLTYLGACHIPTMRQWQLFRWLFMSRLCSCSCSYQLTSYAQQNWSLLTLSKSCINGKTKWIDYDTCHQSCRWVLLHSSAQSISRLKWSHLLSELIGELEHRFSQSFIVKLSGKVDSSSPLQEEEIKLRGKIEGEQHLKLINQ